MPITTTVCVEFTCSPYVCVGLLKVLQFLPCPEMHTFGSFEYLSCPNISMWICVCALWWKGSLPCFALRALRVVSGHLQSWSEWVGRWMNINCLKLEVFWIFISKLADFFFFFVIWSMPYFYLYQLVCWNCFCYVVSLKLVFFQNIFMIRVELLYIDVCVCCIFSAMQFYYV